MSDYNLVQNFKKNIRETRKLEYSANYTINSYLISVFIYCIYINEYQDYYEFHHSFLYGNL